jgi:hypothetical protein
MYKEEENAKIEKWITHQQATSGLQLLIIS